MLHKNFYRILNGIRTAEFQSLRFKTKKMSYAFFLCRYPIQVFTNFLIILIFLLSNIFMTNYNIEFCSAKFAESELLSFIAFIFKILLQIHLKD